MYNSDLCDLRVLAREVPLVLWTSMFWLLEFHSTTYTSTTCLLRLDGLHMRYGAITLIQYWACRAQRSKIY